MKHVSFIDATAGAALTSLIVDFNKTGGTALLAELIDDVLEDIKAGGLYEKIGKDNIFNDAKEAVDYGLKRINVKKMPTLLE